MLMGKDRFPKLSHTILNKMTNNDIPDEYFSELQNRAERDVIEGRGDDR
jgi:hypothetical protein